MGLLIVLHNSEGNKCIIVTYDWFLTFSCTCNCTKYWFLSLKTKNDMNVVEGVLFPPCLLHLKLGAKILPLILGKISSLSGKQKACYKNIVFIKIKLKTKTKLES